MAISKKQVIILTILFTTTALLAVLPFIFIINAADPNWQGIIPAGYVADSEFYIVQMIKGTNLFSLTPICCFLNDFLLI